MTELGWHGLSVVDLSGTQARGIEFFTSHFGDKGDSEKPSSWYRKKHKNSLVLLLIKCTGYN